MRASRRLLAGAVVCLLNFYLSGLLAAQQSDQDIAERVLGPQWKQVSRRAGMIFAGTVLSSSKQSLAIARPVGVTTSAVEFRFRVDEAMAGVEPGQIVTIHEWAGAWSTQRPMRCGQHLLLFLYPASRLGLTSPVGGALGQVVRDASGKNVSDYKRKTVATFDSRNESSPQTGVPVDTNTVMQLERAIRSAREE